MADESRVAPGALWRDRCSSDRHIEIIDEIFGRIPGRRFLVRDLGRGRVRSLGVDHLMQRYQYAGTDLTHVLDRLPAESGISRG